LHKGEDMCSDALVRDIKPAKVELEGGKEYFICACGRSKDGIFCDGSHEGTNCTPLKVQVQESKAYFICMCKTSAGFPFCDGTHKKYSAEDIGKNIQL